MCLTRSILRSVTHSGMKYDFVGGNVMKSGRFHATSPVTSGLLGHPPSADAHTLSSGVIFNPSPQHQDHFPSQ